MLAAAAHHRGGGILIVLLLVVVIGFVIWRLSQRPKRPTIDVESDPNRSTIAAATTSAPSDEATSSVPISTPEAAVVSEGAPTPRIEANEVARTALQTPERIRPLRTGKPGEWAVETHGLTKRFGDNVAVNDVELLVPRGCAFGYLGPNGAGKTTLMRTLLGLTRADSGTMSLLGIPVPSQRARALSRVGAIVDEPRFHGHLSGRENLEILAAARGGVAGQRIKPSMERVGLAGREDHAVGSYSMGMRQRLGVAACLLGDPELLILDEPMNGLDPAGMSEMRNMIHGLVDEGRTVMLSSHLLDEVERTCDAVAIVDHGRVIRQGEIDELLRGTGGGVVQVRCSDPRRAAGLVNVPTLVASVAVHDDQIVVTLAEGAEQAAIAEINRRIVEDHIDVFGLQLVQTTLEDWFLSVTSRIGAPS
jgi:ABC-2 type transport system ATP-binding protein